MTSEDVELRALRDDDDLEAQLDLAERAFGPKKGDDREYWYRLTRLMIRNGTAIGAFAGQRPVGAALFFDMRQWWCGRPVPMAGVGGVKIAPEDRGRGTGRRMMARVLDEIADRGYPLSVLYPATTPIYRSLGWELAGGKYTVTIPARSLRGLVTPDVSPAGPVSAPRKVRRVGPADAREVVDVIGRVHEAARDSGPITWDAEAMAINLGMAGFYSYLADDGFTSYRWRDGSGSLFVAGVEGISADTVRELWSIIASHASVAESVDAWTGPADPLWWLTRERDAEISRGYLWMLRVVDAPAAIAARGFPAGVSITAPLVIEDQVRPANTGIWTLNVDGGKGELVPGSRVDAAAPLAVGARGLAALYAGTPVLSLRQAGLAVGGTGDDDAALDAAFAARPYILDSF